MTVRAIHERIRVTDMTTLLHCALVALIFDAGLLAAAFVRRLSLAPSLVSFAELGPLLITAGVLVALITLLFNMRRTRSEEFLKAATELLEKAYGNWPQMANLSDHPTSGCRGCPRRGSLPRQRS